MSNNNDASSSEGGTGTGGGTRPPALGKTGTARPLLDNLVSLPPKDAVKGNRIKPGSFSLGSPLKPSTRASAAFAQLLQSLASQAAVDEGGDEQGADLNEVFPAIVKVFTTHTFPNYSLPWQMKRSMQSTSTGFIISKERILTNAHSVENYTQVQVRRRGSPTKYIARVIAIGRDCDIALLTVDDPSFWKASKKFIDIGKRRKLPKLEERVAVVGFPIGGENLSVSSGVVSRIDMQEYANGIHDLLAIQVDAPINPGNSGGPVFDGERRFVGIAFQSLTQAEGVGYIIPLPVVHHFLEDLARHEGRYTGFPSLMLDTQGIENPSLRQYLGVPPNVSGVLVIKVQEMSPCNGKVKEGDVLTEIDGHPVGDDQTIEFPSQLVVGEEEQVVFDDDEEDDQDEEEEQEGGPEAMEVEGANNNDAGSAMDEEAAMTPGAEDDGSQWEDVDSPRESTSKFNKKSLRDTLSRKKLAEDKKGMPSRKIRFEGDDTAGEDGEGLAGGKQDGQEEEEGEEETDGAIPLGYAERIDADFLITQRQTDDSVTLTLFNKDSGTRKEKIQLSAPNMLVPPEGTREKRGREDLKLPSYRIIGGAVLTVLTEAYMSSEFGSSGGDASTPLDLLALWTSSTKKYKDEEVVLCAQILAHDSNVGYEGLANMRMVKINGTEVLNLKQVSKVLDEAVKLGMANKEKGVEEGRYIRFDFAKGPVMVMDAWSAQKDTEDVLVQHLIPKDRSEDLE